jgi:ketosteroid isomerase-like protein
MSQENVESNRRVLATFQRRDLDAFLAFMDPELEFTSRVIPVAGDVHYRGHDGIREWWKDLLTVFPDFQVEAIEIRDLGGEWTVVAARVSGRGADSDAPFEQPIWQAVQWRDGKVVCWATFDTEAEALKAVGLKE